MSKNESEERFQILEMVEKGAINASEALTLLDALEILRIKGGL
jgi:hypothetical protein